MVRALQLMLLTSVVLSLCSIPTVSAQDQAAMLPMPPEEAQQAAAKLIRQAYQREYDAARTGSGNIDLARRLLEQGDREPADAVHQFVLYREARDVAVSAGESDYAMFCIDALARRFAIDAIQMKVSALEQVGRTARKPAQYKSLALHALSILDEAVERDRYADALKLADAARVAARHSGERELAVTAAQRAGHAEELSREHARIEPAREVLAARPDDPAANSAVGAFVCYWKGSWQAGLPHLARGSDEGSKQLAAQDLANPAPVEDQVLLADGWWELAGEEAGIAQRNLYRRSAHWYRMAARQASGVLRTKCESRLVEIACSFVFDGRGRIATDLEQFAPATFEAWIRPDLTQHAVWWASLQRQRFIGWIIGSDAGGEAGNGFGLMDRKLCAGNRTGFIESIAEPQPEEWSHVAVVFGVRQTRIYLDGRRVASGQPKAVGKGSRYVFGCFGEENASGFFHGQMRSARFSTVERYDGDFAPPQVLYADPQSSLVLDAAVVQDGVAIDLSDAGQHGRLRNVDVLPTGTAAVEQAAGDRRPGPPRVTIRRGAKLATRALRVGATYMADRDYRIAAFPGEMRDGLLIVRDAGGVKAWLPAGQIQVDRDCTAYVALICEANGKEVIAKTLLQKLQLEGWEPVSDDFATTTPGTERWVWKVISKPVPKGVVDLSIKSKVPETHMMFVFR